MEELGVAAAELTALGMFACFGQRARECTYRKEKWPLGLMMSKEKRKMMMRD